MVVFDLACALTERGHKVVVFATKESKVPPNGFLYEIIDPVYKVHVNWLEREKQMFEVYKDKLRDFDITNSHTWFHFPYLAKQQTPSLKICATHHGHLNWKSKPPSVENMNFIAISKFMAQEYAAILGPAGVKHIHFVYNGIDLDRYHYKKNHGDRLIYIGRFAEYKGGHVAIEVAKKLKMPLDVVGGTFVEKPEYVEQLKVECQRNNFGWYPDAPHEVKMKLLRKAKALLFPSRMSEPFGLVAVEAMACGTPVVATNDGAIGEVVQDGLTGFVCNVYDVTRGADGRLSLNVKRDPAEAMCEAVKKVDSIKPKNCRRLVEQNFTRQIMSKKYEARYNMMLKGEEW